VTTVFPLAATRSVALAVPRGPSSFVVPSDIEDSPPPNTAVSLLLAGGLVLTGLLSGTGTTAPIAESPLRYIGGWTSTARVVGVSAVPPPARRSRASAAAPAAAAGVAASAETAPPAATDESVAITEHRDTPAEEIRWLHVVSGLTWEQLGRVFGVSRRAVHLWANGRRMNSTNAELLGQLVAVVSELPGGTADARRAALLAAGTDGSSLVDRLRARNRSDARDVTGTPFRPEELLGGRRESLPDAPDETGLGTAQT